MERIGMAEDWEPPEDWESDVIYTSVTGDVVPLATMLVSGVFVVGLLLSKAGIISGSLTALWCFVVAVALAGSLVAIGVDRGQAAAMNFWPPGHPEQAVIIAWAPPTIREAVAARLRGKPVPPMRRNVHTSR